VTGAAVRWHPVRREHDVDFLVQDAAGRGVPTPSEIRVADRATSGPATPNGQAARRSVEARQEMAMHWSPVCPAAIGASATRLEPARRMGAVIAACSRPSRAHARPCRETTGTRRPRRHQRAKGASTCLLAVA
jgi:hypothetical protein